MGSALAQVARRRAQAGGAPAYHKVVVQRDKAHFFHAKARDDLGKKNVQYFGLSTAVTTSLQSRLVASQSRCSFQWRSKCPKQGCRCRSLSRCSCGARLQDSRARAARRRCSGMVKTFHSRHPQQRGRSAESTCPGIVARRCTWRRHSLSRCPPPSAGRRASGGAASPHRTGFLRENDLHRSPRVIAEIAH